MTETFAYEVLVWSSDYAGFKAVAVTLGHARLVIEEELQPLGLQNRALALAAYSTGKGSIAASATFEAAISEIDLSNTAATLANKQRTRPNIPPESSAKPAQWYWLNISAVVMYLDILQRNYQAFNKWISKG
jgi:hypothetical protein